MMIPVICDTCGHLAHLKRLEFAWATFCQFCHFACLKYDSIQLGQENRDAR